MNKVNYLRIIDEQPILLCCHLSNLKLTHKFCFYCEKVENSNYCLMNNRIELKFIASQSKKIIIKHGQVLKIVAFFLSENSIFGLK